MQLINFIESAGDIGERKIQIRNGSNTYNAGVIYWYMCVCMYLCVPCVCMYYALSPLVSIISQQQNASDQS